MERLTNIQLLAQIKRDTGKTIRLYPLEEVTGVMSLADRMTVRVARVWTEERRCNQVAVTHKGVSLYQFNRTPDGWRAMRPFTQRWSIPSELHTSLPQRTPDTEWEMLCYRPGAPEFPLDNEARKAQGY